MTKTTKTTLTVIGLLAALALIATAIMWPASAYFNAKTGTLSLMARFRRKKYALKDYLGKTELKVIGPVIFDVDYQKPGVILYSITLKSSSKSLLKGEVKYNYADTVTTQLPPGVAEEPAAQQQAAKGACACQN